MNNRLISIIIPTVGRTQELNRLLSALTLQTYENYEVIIVKRGSIDNISQTISPFKRKMRVKVLCDDRGLTKGLNLGIANAEGSIVVRTDDDACPTPFWLDELIKPFGLGPRVGASTGPSIAPSELRENRDSLRFIYKILESKKLAYLLLRTFYFGIILEGKWYHPGLITRSGATTWGSAFGIYSNDPDLKPIKVMFMSPTNMALRVDVLQKIGFFDENYRSIGTYCEPDLAFRLLKASYDIIYNPKAITYHLVSKTGVLSRVSTFDEGYNFVYYISKNVIPYYGSACIPKAVLNALLTGGYWLYLFRKTKDPKSLGGFKGMLVAAKDRLFL